MRDVKREAVGAKEDTQLTAQWKFYPANTVKILSWTSAGWKSHSLTETTTGVAQKSTVFGEGAERVVHHFRYVGAGGQFWNEGPQVAKEGRFNEDLSGDPLDFHKTFCKTQLASEELATVFNSRLAKIPGVTQVPLWS